MLKVRQALKLPTMNYKIIDQQADLEAFCEHLKTCPWIALDTEFVRTDTYFSILSLIQIQTHEGQAAIIDPIAIEDLTALWSIITHPDIRKVFHSARQDIEVLYQVSGQMPVSIYDTQIACLFLHHGDLAGLARVVKAELNFTLEKDQTRTNWQQRPLTDKQLEYAINDVRYLAPLYEKLQSELTDAQQAALEDDFQALLNEDLYKIDVKSAGKKIKAAKKLSRKNKAIAYKLAEWREQFAIEHNKPKRWVMSDEVLVAIAKRPPKTPEALYKVPHIKASSVKNYGAEWVELIDEVFESPDNWPKPVIPSIPPTPQEEVLVSIGFALIQQIAIDYNVNPNNIANKADLLKMIQSDTFQLTGWRALLLGTPFRQFLENQLVLGCNQDRLVQKTFTPNTP